MASGHRSTTPRGTKPLCVILSLNTTGFVMHLRHASVLPLKDGRATPNKNVLDAARAIQKEYGFYSGTELKQLESLEHRGASCTEIPTTDIDPYFTKFHIRMLNDGRSMHSMVMPPPDLPESKKTWPTKPQCVMLRSPLHSVLYASVWLRF